MPSRCAACPADMYADHALRLAQEIVTENFFLCLLWVTVMAFYCAVVAHWMSRRSALMTMAASEHAGSWSRASWASRLAVWVSPHAQWM